MINDQGAKASVAYQDPRTEPVLMTAKAQSAAESSNTMDAKLKSTTKQTYIKDDDFTFRPSSERAHASRTQDDPLIRTRLKTRQLISSRCTILLK